MRYLLTFFAVSVISLNSFCQANAAKSAPAYAQYPLPQFSILLSDSTTWYTKDQLPKGKKVIVMLFSPDCEHCKHETEQIKKNIEVFKKSHILMITTLPLEKMREFTKHYDLAQYKNITVAKDPKYFFASYYKIRYLPFIAVYDKKHEFLKSFEGNPKWEEFEKVVKVK
ncbi:MAG: TlpA family protein disulfide reductase [Agriterribacter sp.]